MPIFEAGSVVRVPFPYTDRETRQHRPALVVSEGGTGPDSSLLWVVMITSAVNRGWPGDVSLEEDHEAAGLPVPSIVRTAKIATIDGSLAEPIGMLDAARLNAVKKAIASHLGIK